MLALLSICVFLGALCGAVKAAKPSGAIQVFVRGEGGYYCHKIPYLFRTMSNVLIALAEGRGRDGREACDDFSVRIFVISILKNYHNKIDTIMI